MKVNLKYGSYEASYELGQYANGRTAIQLYDEEDGCPLLTATVNIPELPEEHIKLFCEEYGYEKSQFLLIKDYSENQGIYQSLYDAGLIEATWYFVPTGYTNARVAFWKGGK
jgi:hypothetical protein